jgi:hypothetical protein
MLDRLSSDAIAVMLEYNNDLHGKGISPESQKRTPWEIPGLMQIEWDELALAVWVKNPLLELKGQECRWSQHFLSDTSTDLCDFDITRDLAVRILHVLILGPAKYLAGVTKQMLSTGAIDKMMQVHMEAFPTAGIYNGRQLNAAYLIQHANTLVGKCDTFACLDRSPCFHFKPLRLESPYS